MFKIETVEMIKICGRRFTLDEGDVEVFYISRKDDIEGIINFMYSLNKVNSINEFTEIKNLKSRFINMIFRKFYGV